MGLPRRCLLLLVLVRVGVEIATRSVSQSHLISAFAKGSAATVKKEKVGCNGSHTGPEDCKLAPEDGRVQQKIWG